MASEPHKTHILCRALDVLPLRPGRTEGRRRLAVVDPRRHKPDSAKGSAPRGPVQPIGPENSKRAPAKRRASASEEASPPLDAGQLCRAVLLDSEPAKSMSTFCAYVVPMTACFVVRRLQYSVLRCQTGY